MKVSVSGSRGFIGTNLTQRLSELGWELVRINRDDSETELKEKLSSVDVLVHLAGVNRPKDVADFLVGNVDFTSKVLSVCAKLPNKIPVIFSSSIQALLDNPYGKSKNNAEDLVNSYSKETQTKCVVLRLPNVFGKWSKPNYNSAVATFCYSIANNLPFEVHDKNTVVTLSYVDDVCHCIVENIKKIKDSHDTVSLKDPYQITLGALVEKLQFFNESRKELTVGEVGHGLDRALYSTYLSFVPPKNFSYEVKKHADPRGEFVEMLKTPHSGQVSYFTAFPGITRGGHYHHTKTEKFLVVAGQALFRFKNLNTNERCELLVEGGSGKIVDTIPGWVHDITNVGKDKMIVMLWANEVFDREQPDTFASEV